MAFRIPHRRQRQLLRILSGAAVLPALTLCALIFTGCPQTLIERVEKILPPPGYKPRFNTSSVSLDSLARRYQDAVMKGTVDSSVWYDDAAVVTSADTLAVQGSGYVVPAPDPLRAGESSAGFVPTDTVRMRAGASRVISARAGIAPSAAMMNQVNEAIGTLPKVQQDSVRMLMMSAMMSGGRIPPDTLRARAERMLASLPPERRDTILHQFTRMRELMATRQESDDSLQTDVAGAGQQRPARREAPARLHLRSLIDKSYPSQIELQLTLTDSTGRAILGCAPPYLRADMRAGSYWVGLQDSCNGERSVISTFSVEEVRESSTDPYALAFVIDHSGSMGKTRIRKLREAVKSTLSIIGTTDMVTVMPFAGSSGVDVLLTSDTALMRSSMDIEKHASIKPGTAIYDATIHAVRELSAAPKEKKRAILMFTDGEDGSSKSKLTDAIRAARDSGVAVYAIAYGLTNEEPLLALAQKTGGQFYRIYSTREFPLVFRDIYRSLKNYYRIRYAPPPCAGIHTVRAELRIPEIGVKRLVASGTYDKSLFTDLDSVGSITFLNIEFTTGSADIQPGSSGDLDVMAAALLAHPRTVMEIRGHTDDRGTPQTNERLSLQRADAVARALQERGVDASRLRTRGFGSSQPLVPNTSDDNRAKNRRTEFVIVAQ